MNNSIRVALFLGLILTVAGCISQPRIAGIPTEYVPFQGDPTSVHDVKIYGPGSITTVPSGNNDASTPYWADFIIGDEVTQMAKDAPVAISGSSTATVTPLSYTMVTGTSNVSASLSGSTPSTIAAYSLHAALAASGTTTNLGYSFINKKLYVFTPYPESTLGTMVKKIWPSLDGDTQNALIRKKMFVVYKAYFAAGVSYTYSKSGSGNLNVGASIPKAVEGQIAGAGFNATNKSLDYQSPIFLGYAPLDPKWYAPQTKD